AAGDQDIHGQADQLAPVGAHPIGIAGGPANLDLDVAALDPPELVELLAQRRISSLSLRIALGVDQDHAQPSDALALLRARGGRPKNRRRHRRAAEQRDELAPLHSITSSRVLEAPAASR